MKVDYSRLFTTVGRALVRTTPLLVCLGLLTPFTVHARPGIPMPKPFAQQWVCLKTHNGQLVQTLQMKSQAVATQTRCGKWQQVKIIDANGGKLVNGDKVYIKTRFGTYWNVKETGELKTRLVVKAGKKPSNRATFTIYDYPRRRVEGRELKTGDLVAFRTHYNKFIIAEDGGGRELLANRTVARKWSKFRVRAPLRETPAIKNWSGPIVKSVKSQARKSVEGFIKRTAVPGVAVGLITPDSNGRAKVLDVFARGYTDKKKKKKLTTKTRLRWASISKTVTAVTAMQLVESGKLSLSKYVRYYFPYWAKTSGLKKEWRVKKPKKGKPDHRRIKVGHLLTNTGGINHYGKGVKKGDKQEKVPKGCEKHKGKLLRKLEKKWSAKKSVKVFGSCPLVAKPGKAYVYTSYGYNLLGSVVHAAGGDYIGQVRKRIANPMGMSSMMTSGEYCKAYNKTKKKKTKKDFYKKCFKGYVGKKRKSIDGVNWKLPSGGWVSNIKDLSRFAVGVMTPGKLLKKPSSLWEDNEYSLKNSYRYGIKRGSKGETLYVYHDGIADGIRTLFMVFPELNKGVAIMINQRQDDGWSIYDLAEELFLILDTPI